MSRKLTRAEREAIVFDHLKGKPTPGYNVIETKTGHYCVTPVKIEIYSDSENETGCPSEHEQPSCEQKENVLELLNLIRHNLQDSDTTTTSTALPPTQASVLVSNLEMLNTEINEFAAQTNLTQVASYFDMVDNVVKAGDSNKKYHISTNACGAPAAPIQNGGWTVLTISPTVDNIADLYNSFIYAEMGVRVGVDHKLESKFVNKDGTKAPAFWIGFKDSLQPSRSTRSWLTAQRSTHRTTQSRRRSSRHSPCRKH